jgi:DHA1 family multidrug resistance protein-like MFS transporter
MGLSHAFMSLGRIVGPLLAGVLFDLDIRLPYLVGAVAMAVGFVVSLVWVVSNCLSKQFPGFHRAVL